MYRVLHNRLALWKILLLAFIAVTAFQGSRGLYETTEGRYAECAREMLVTGRFLEPTLEFLPHWTKPPLTYWGIAGGMALLGQNAWGARAYLILAFCLTVLAVHGLARYLWGRDVAPYAALVYASAPFPLAAANTINADTLLTLWETLAMLGFWAGVRECDARGFRIMWLCLGGAFFTKGPPGLMPLMSILPVYGFMKKKQHLNLPSFFPVSGILLFLGVGLGWYAYEITLHEGLLHYWMTDEIVGRIATREFRRNSEWYQFIIVYFPVLIFGGLPWIALVARHHKSIPWPGARWMEGAYWKNHVEWLFLLLSFSAPFLLFALSRSRLPLYVLPLFVSVALALGKGIHWLVEKGRVSSVLVNCLALATVCVVIVGKAVMVYYPSHRNMERLLLEIEEAAPEAHRGRFYLVSDHPLYGLHFYMKESFVRVTEKPTLTRTPVRIPVSELPAKLKSECIKGGKPVLLMAQDELGRMREILPPDFRGDTKNEMESFPENEPVTLSMSNESEGIGGSSPYVTGSFEVRELKPPWALVFPCGHPMLD